MACEKHGYTNNTFCPACDQELIAEFERSGFSAAMSRKDLIRRLENVASYVNNALNDLKQSRGDPDYGIWRARKELQKIEATYPEDGWQSPPFVG